MKKSVIFFLTLAIHLSANAQNVAGKKIADAKFQIIKATVEFLASDKETFKKVKQKQCADCIGYEDLLKFVKINKLTNADEVIGQWKKVSIDTTVTSWENSIEKFKKRVISDITTPGEKIKRKQLPNYSSYESRLDSIINRVSISEPIVNLLDSVKVQEAQVSVVALNKAEPDKIMSEKSLEPISFFAFLPNISKDMSYSAILLLLIAILLLLWILRNRSKRVKRNSRALEDLKHKTESLERESKNMTNVLNDAQQKLKTAQEEFAILEDNVRAEKERNERLSVEPKIEKTFQKIGATVLEPLVKFARYADQGDGFSVQELLDVADSETIFELTVLSTNNATFKISDNQNAQRYALSNSPYFLGKTSQYDTFPSGNSLINTDVPGELKLQGNKWLIIKPIQISFI